MSKKQNDWILRCLPSEACQQTSSQAARCNDELEACKPVASAPSAASPVASPIAAPTSAELLAIEVQLLRAENAKLRIQNETLLQTQCEDDELHNPPISGATEQIDQLPHHVYDDPFEPPPEKCGWTASGSWTPTSTCSTGEFEFGMSACGTPLSGSSCEIASGAMTPIVGYDCHTDVSNTPMLGGLGDKVCTLVPVWFQVIPTGIVDRFRTQIESVTGPSAKPPMPHY